MRLCNQLFIIIALLTIAFFSSCDGNDDTQAPSIYFLDSGGNVVPDDEADKTILLLTSYSDYGIQVEDNVSDQENIITENDIIEVLSTNAYGQVRRTGVYTITYTAIDEAQNVETKTKEIKVENISKPFTGTYSTERTNSQVAETLYNSNVTADSQIPGRLIFSKVYAQSFEGGVSSFRVVADLFSLEHSNSYSDTYAYMGGANDSESVFYVNLDCEQALDSILSFSLLRVAAQEFTDDFGNNVRIAGREQNSIPLSRIEYHSGTKNIYRMVLELNVTFNGVPDSQLIEVYTPQ